MESVGLLLAGLAVLTLGAEWLVRGASRFALQVGLPPIAVGLTIVAYGTSMPELIVSAKAALVGNADIAIGNVVGSNIFNVLFILGASACILPLVISKAMVQREVPLMIGVSLLFAALAYDGSISRGDGLFLVTLLLIYTVMQVRLGLKAGHDPDQTTVHELQVAKESSVLKLVSFIVFGLIFLGVGAQWLLQGAVAIAKDFGVSDLVIGLTIVAAGTSLPEVATSIMATIRGQRDIAVGNVVGSNVYNILGVLGVSSALSKTGISITPAALQFDIPVMVVITLLCLPVFWTGRKITRGEGVVFLALYVAYTAYLVMNTHAHPPT